MLCLAAIPGYALAKQLIIVHSTSWWPVMLCTGLVELLCGTRFQLVGMLSFQTLPSRELVAIWQLLTILAGTLIPLVVLITAYTAELRWANNTNLLIGVGVTEGVRLLAMLALSLVHRSENLTAL